jgi:hypothetical protein
MQRPHFQDGRMLRTSDYVDEQAYHLTAHRRHNVTGHRWGVAAGLGVVLLDGDLVVEPGLAVDGYGRDVVLNSASGLDLRGFDVRGIEAVDVWVDYDRLRLQATEDGVDLLVDAAVIELTDAADIDPRRPPGVDPADLDHPGSRPPPDDPVRRWPVYLGRITRDLTAPEEPPVIETDRRPWIGLVGGSVVTPGGPPWLALEEGADPTLTVGLPDAAGNHPLTISGAAGVRLDAQLTIGGELVLRGGALVLDPAGPPIATPPPDTAEWSLSHSVGDVAHELRVAMPPAAAGDPPRRLVVGAWQDGKFVPRVVIDEGGTVMIAGNLVVGGWLKAVSVQEAQLSESARAYLAGLQVTSLPSLFAVAGEIV